MSVLPTIHSELINERIALSRQLDFLLPEHRFLAENINCDPSQSGSKSPSGSRSQKATNKAIMQASVATVPAE